MLLGTDIGVPPPTTRRSIISKHKCQAAPPDLEKLLQSNQRRKFQHLPLLNKTTSLTSVHGTIVHQYFYFNKRNEWCDFHRSPLKWVECMFLYGIGRNNVKHKKFYTQQTSRQFRSSKAIQNFQRKCLDNIWIYKTGFWKKIPRWNSTVKMTTKNSWLAPFGDALFAISSFLREFVLKRHVHSNRKVCSRKTSTLGQRKACLVTCSADASGQVWGSGEPGSSGVWRGGGVFHKNNTYMTPQGRPFSPKSKAQIAHCLRKPGKYFVREKTRTSKS